MKAFLEHVAEDMIRKFGTDLSRTAVVFPNKRASLFFNDYLVHEAGKPLWSPTYMTISELFRSHSSLTVGDPLKLVADLHRCFCQCTGTDETFDHFYGWGQLLLSDFDDIDKNLADAKKVFALLRDYHELDDVSYLNAEQIAIIKKFFSNFSAEHNTELKRRFLQLWSRFYDVYQLFNQHLTAQHLAYEGALYRQVVTDENVSFEYERYVFVGFNLLQKVEQRLFLRLRKEGRAYFYWDYDRYYMHHEAGRYISSYLERFPNELSADRDDIFDNFSRPRTLTYVSAATENIQARYVSTWLKDRQRLADGRRTAIIMCNENLLPSVVYSLPPEAEKVNVTTGYPLSQAPVATLLFQLVSLQTVGFDRQSERYRLRFVNALLRNPFAHYISDRCSELYDQLNNVTKVYHPTPSQLGLDEGTRLLFFPSGAPSELSPAARLASWLVSMVRHVATRYHEIAGNEADDMTTESLFRAYTLLNRLSELLVSGQLSVETPTFLHLLRQLLQTTAIPFHGEPAEGIQVMGVLETRNLDFDHVLVLSCNEGQMPKGVRDTSFIPFSIRKAYELTTVDNKVAIYAYYFHRLLQRAGDITLVYNRSTNGLNTGEMSRFMLQMMAESGHRVVHKSLSAGQVPRPFAPQSVDKNDQVMSHLLATFDLRRRKPGDERPLLTPTAINTYLRCPLQFYYKYVGGLREPDDTDDRTIDNRVFGNIFHAASQKIYQPMIAADSRIGADQLRRLLHTRVEIERAVDQAFKEELFRLPPDAAWHPDYSGLQLIHREVVVRYLRQLLTLDLRLAPFRIIGLETDVQQPYTVRLADGQTLATTIGGRIDRLDRICDERGERIRVVDYKTGNRTVTGAPSVEAVFARGGEGHGDYFVQTFLYATLVSHSVKFNPSSLPVSPALLFIQHTTAADYDPTLSIDRHRVTDIGDIEQPFSELLDATITEIFDRTRPFNPPSDRSVCRLCPYARLCSTL